MTEHGPDEDATRVDVPVTDRTMAMPATPGGPPPSGPPPTGPPERPGDPRWWILGALLAAIVAAGIAILLLSDDDDTVTAATTTTSFGDTTTSSSSTTTTTEATTTTTTAPAPTVDPSRCTSGAPDDADSSVEVLFEAYTLGDLECAHQVATEDAVEALFAIPGGGGGWTYQGCFDQLLPDPHTDCAYTFPGGATHFKTNYSDTDGWVIFEVYQTTD